MKRARDSGAVSAHANRPAKNSSAAAISSSKSAAIAPVAVATEPASTVAPSGGVAGASAGAGASAAAGRMLWVVLEQASLETVKTKRGFELLNSDEHGGHHARAGRSAASSRPDITHQLLLALLDSPLNKAGLLRVLVQTAAGVLIEVSPATRIPRTYARFAGLMVQLLHSLRVRAADSPATLLRVVKNSPAALLPANATCIGLEAGARLVDAYDLPSLLPAGEPVVIVVGAMSHGDITADWVSETYSLSRYPLSAACAVSKLLNGFERHWGVL